MFRAWVIAALLLTVVSVTSAQSGLAKGSATLGEIGILLPAKGARVFLDPNLGTAMLHLLLLALEVGWVPWVFLAGCILLRRPIPAGGV